MTINNIRNLKEKFLKVYNLGWIKHEKGTGNTGCILEKLLEVKSGNFEIPDFDGIEIKTKNVFSRSYIKLFNATPDGKYLFETKRIRERYGYPDSKIKNVKVFNSSMYASKNIKIGIFYLFKLQVNPEERKIYLNVFDKNNKLIDNDTYWSFELLKEKLLRKLQILAVVDVLEKKEKYCDYLKYNDINFYQLKNFDTFIDLIDKGVVRVTFKINVFRKGKRFGEMHDHGTSFEIQEENLNKLYNKMSI